MKNLTRWVLGLFLVLSFSSICFSGETVRITTGEYSPFSSEKLKDYGIIAQIITESFALEGIKVEYGFFPWGRAYDLAKEGDWDSSSFWVFSKERAEDFLLSDPLMESDTVFFPLKSFQFDWDDINDLKGIDIGATIEYFYGEDFKKAEESKMIIVDRVPTDKMNFRKLLQGRIKIFPIDQYVGSNLLRTDFKPEENNLITFHPKPLLSQKYYLLFSKKVEKNKQRLELFNKGLKRLKESKRFDQLLLQFQQGK
jgi:polar amino acid transport system substrate-binding protein